MLQPKCKVMAEHLDRPMGSLVLLYDETPRNTEKETE